MDINQRDKKVLIAGIAFVVCYLLFFFVAEPIYKKQAKVDGKIKILLLANGKMKEELLANLVDLENYLRKKDIDLFSIDVLELGRDASYDKDAQSGNEQRQDNLYEELIQEEMTE